MMIEDENHLQIENGFATEIHSNEFSNTYLFVIARGCIWIKFYLFDEQQTRWLHVLGTIFYVSAFFEIFR